MHAYIHYMCANTVLHKFLKLINASLSEIQPIDLCGLVDTATVYDSGGRGFDPGFRAL